MMSALGSNDIKKKNGGEMANLPPQAMRIDELEGSSIGLVATVPLHYTTPTSSAIDVASIARSIEMLPRDQQQLIISRFINQVAPTIEGVMNSPVATNLNASLIAGGGTTKSAIDEGKTLTEKKGREQQELKVSPLFSKNNLPLFIKNTMRSTDTSPSTKRTIFMMDALSYLAMQFSMEHGRATIMTVLQDIANAGQADEMLALIRDNNLKALWDKVFYMRLNMGEVPTSKMDIKPWFEPLDTTVLTMSNNVERMGKELDIFRSKCNTSSTKDPHWIMLVLSASIFIQVSKDWTVFIMDNNSSEKEMEERLELWFNTHFALLEKDGVMYEIVGEKMDRDECAYFLHKFGLIQGMERGRCMVKEKIKEKLDRYQAAQASMAIYKQGIPQWGVSVSSPQRTMPMKVPVEQDGAEAIRVMQNKKALKEKVEELSQLLASYKLQQTNDANGSQRMTRSMLGTSEMGQVPDNAGSLNVNISDQEDQINIPSVEWDDEWFGGMPTFRNFRTMMEDSISSWIAYYQAQANMSSLTSMADILNHLEPNVSKVVGTKRWKWLNQYAKVPLGDIDSIADVSQYRLHSVWYKIEMIIGACAPSTVHDLFDAIDSITWEAGDFATDESRRQWVSLVRRFVYMLLGRSSGIEYMRSMLEGINQYQQALGEYQEIQAKEKISMKDRVADPSIFQKHNNSLELLGSKGDPEIVFSVVLRNAFRQNEMMRYGKKLYGKFFTTSDISDEEWLAHVVSNNMLERKVRELVIDSSEPTRDE